MLGKLKLLLKDTVIYGTSTILARGLNYVLVPLYANLLTTFENGVHALVYANIALLNVLFAYGMETAYLKTASDALRADGDRSSYFSTGFLALLLTSTIFATLLVLFAPVVARAIGLDAPEGEFVRYAAVILWLDALLVVPFADLRLQRRALRFAAARVTGVLAVVVSAWVMIVQMGFGLKGAFFANIAGSLVSLLLVLPAFSGLKPFFSSSRLGEMLRLGLPYVPTGIAGLLIHLIDRNVLIRMPRESIERLYGPGLEASDVVGIYGRIAAFGILLQLFIQVFRFAWQPFFLQHADDPESKPLFRQVLTLSTLFTMLVAVGATFFVPDLVQWHIGGAFYLLPPPYWIGLSVLPWIFWSYVFDMASTNLSAGILITGTTRYLPVVTFAGAAVTTAVCVGLVPMMGMDGAGVAILAGTVVMSLCMALFSLKVYPNRYEWGRLGVVLAGGVVCTRVPAVFGNDSILLEAGLLLMFGALVLLVFRTEVRYVLNAVGRRRG